MISFVFAGVSLALASAAWAGPGPAACAIQRSPADQLRVADRLIRERALLSRGRNLTDEQKGWLGGLELDSFEEAAISRAIRDLDGSLSPQEFVSTYSRLRRENIGTATHWLYSKGRRTLPDMKNYTPPANQSELIRRLRSDQVGRRDRLRDMYHYVTNGPKPPDPAVLRATPRDFLDEDLERLINSAMPLDPQLEFRLGNVFIEDRISVVDTIARMRTVGRSEDEISDFVESFGAMRRQGRRIDRADFASTHVQGGAPPPPIEDAMFVATPPANGGREITLKTGGRRKGPVEPGQVMLSREGLDHYRNDAIQFGRRTEVDGRAYGRDALTVRDADGAVRFTRAPGERVRVTYETVDDAGVRRIVQETRIVRAFDADASVPSSGMLRLEDPLDEGMMLDLRLDGWEFVHSTRRIILRLDPAT